METRKRGNYTIKIQQDDNSMNPRTDFDNLGKMVCFHRRYDLGDKHDYDSANYNGWDEMEEDIIKREKVGVILPLYLYDHSGITMNTTGFSCRWDSGQVGFIYVTKEDLLKEYGGKKMTKKLREKGQLLLTGEVDFYDKYISGDVYYIEIEDEDGNEVDSYGSIFGYEYIDQTIDEMIGVEVEG